MASSNGKSTFQQASDDTVTVTNLEGIQSLQLEAIRRGEGELALLLPHKQAAQAAKHYHQMSQCAINNQLKRKVVYERHQTEVEIVKKREQERQVMVKEEMKEEEMK